jgi:hypothetical protein
MNRDFIGDEDLRSLQQQDGEFKCGKPTWQLFLVFLSHENCLDLVNIYDGENHSFGVILHPFTVHTTILHVLETNVLITPHIQSRDNSMRRGLFCEPVSKPVKLKHKKLSFSMEIALKNQKGNQKSK